MKPSDFYGGTAPVSGGSPVAVEVPVEQRSVGLKPAQFWLIMVGLLVLARILYEASE